MKFVFDSSAWVEYLKGTAQAEKLNEILETVLVGTSICALAEIADRCEKYNQDAEKAITFIEAKATIIPITTDILLRAAKLKNHLRKTRPKFGLFDALHLATAEQQHATFVTADADFSGLNNVLLL